MTHDRTLLATYGKPPRPPKRIALRKPGLSYGRGRTEVCKGVTINVRPQHVRFRPFDSRAREREERSQSPFLMGKRVEKFRGTVETPRHMGSRVYERGARHPLRPVS